MTGPLVQRLSAVYAKKEYLSGFCYISGNSSGLPDSAHPNAKHWFKVASSSLSLWTVPDEVAHMSYTPSPTPEKIVALELQPAAQLIARLTKAEPTVIDIQHSAVQFQPPEFIPNICPLAPIPYTHYVLLSVMDTSPAAHASLIIALPSLIQSTAFTHAVLLSQYELHQIQSYSFSKTLSDKIYITLWQELGLIQNLTLNQRIKYASTATVRTISESKEYHVIINNLDEKKFLKKASSVEKKIIGSEEKRLGSIILHDVKSRTPLYHITNVLYAVSISEKQTKIFASIFPMVHTSKKNKKDDLKDTSKDGVEFLIFESKTMQDNYKLCISICACFGICTDYKILERDCEREECGIYGLAEDFGIIQDSKTVSIPEQTVSSDPSDDIPLDRISHKSGKSGSSASLSFVPSLHSERSVEPSPLSSPKKSTISKKSCASGNKSISSPPTISSGLLSMESIEPLSMDSIISVSSYSFEKSISSKSEKDDASKKSSPDSHVSDSVFQESILSDKQITDDTETKSITNISIISSNAKSTHSTEVKSTKSTGSKSAKSVTIISTKSDNEEDEVIHPIAKADTHSSDKKSEKSFVSYSSKSSIFSSSSKSHVPPPSPKWCQLFLTLTEVAGLSPLYPPPTIDNPTPSSVLIKKSYSKTLQAKKAALRNGSIIEWHQKVSAREAGRRVWEMGEVLGKAKQLCSWFEKMSSDVNEDVQEFKGRRERRVVHGFDKDAARKAYDDQGTGEIVDYMDGVEADRNRITKEADSFASEEVSDTSSSSSSDGNSSDDADVEGETKVSRRTEAYPILAPGFIHTLDNEPTSIPSVVTLEEPIEDSLYTESSMIQTHLQKLRIGKDKKQGPLIALNGDERRKGEMGLDQREAKLYEETVGLGGSGVVDEVLKNKLAEKLGKAEKAKFEGGLLGIIERREREAKYYKQMGILGRSAELGVYNGGMYPGYPPMGSMYPPYQQGMNMQGHTGPNGQMYPIMYPPPNQLYHNQLPQRPYSNQMYHQGPYSNQMYHQQTFPNQMHPPFQSAHHAPPLTGYPNQMYPPYGMNLGYPMHNQNSSPTGPNVINSTRRASEIHISTESSSSDHEAQDSSDSHIIAGANKKKNAKANSTESSSENDSEDEEEIKIAPLRNSQVYQTSSQIQFKHSINRYSHASNNLPKAKKTTPTKEITPKTKAYNERKLAVLNKKAASKTETLEVSPPKAIRKKKRYQSSDDESHTADASESKLEEGGKAPVLKQGDAPSQLKKQPAVVKTSEDDEEEELSRVREKPKLTKKPNIKVRKAGNKKKEKIVSSSSESSESSESD